MAAKPLVSLDIWSDLACPWWCDSQNNLCDDRYNKLCQAMRQSSYVCSYVGKRRLDKALELNKERANFRIQWYMFIHSHAFHDGLLSLPNPDLRDLLAAGIPI